jgi:DNA-binding response OmpR family regulator/S1-C subfamily serine protease
MDFLKLYHLRGHQLLANPVELWDHRKKRIFMDKPGRILVVECDDALRERILAVLTDAGYEVSGDCSEGMKTVLSFAPDAVIMGADPPQLDCCSLLSEIKGSEQTQNIRVVMLAPGGSAERTRGLDLGADDVVSLPFDANELLSRVRSQLRTKHIADESRERLHRAEENRSATRQVVRAVKEGRRTVRVGVLAALGVLIVGALVFLLFYRRTQEQNTRVYAAITRLQSGVLTQQQLLERSRRALEEQQRASSAASDAQKQQLQQKIEDLKSQVSSGKAADTSAVNSQLATIEGRIQRLESEGKVAQMIIQSYEPSVCLIRVVLSFRDRTTGSTLHYAGLTSDGHPTTDEHNNPLVSLTGNGPEVRLTVFGTGFLASTGGQILTNHHVAEPWWQNDEMKEMLDQGLEPVVIDMTAYFPGVTHGIAIKTEKISSAADVAVVKANVSQMRVKQIALADGRRAAVSGGAVVLLGYPTALDAILARIGEETLESIATVSKGDPKQVMEELARRGLIRPIATQGHIGDVLPDKIVYDAQTTSGGSGGPLFNNEGKVIGINFAMVREFGGSNFAIPVRYGTSLLKP